MTKTTVLKVSFPDKRQTGYTDLPMKDSEINEETIKLGLLHQGWSKKDIEEVSVSIKDF